MAAPFSVTAPSSVQNLMNSSSRRSMVSRGVLMIETNVRTTVIDRTHKQKTAMIGRNYRDQQWLVGHTENSNDWSETRTENSIDWKGTQTENMMQWQKRAMICIGGFRSIHGRPLPGYNLWTHETEQYGLVGHTYRIQHWLVGHKYRTALIGRAHKQWTALIGRAHIQNSIDW